MFTISLNLDNCPEKTKVKNLFHILNSRDFLLIPTTLDNGYIDRQKLTEQKNPFEYVVPPTH